MTAGAENANKAIASVIGFICFIIWEIHTIENGATEVAPFL